MKYENIQKLFREAYDKDKENTLEILELLYNSKLKPILCVKLLSNELNISFPEANMMIINSGFWKKEVDNAQEFTSKFGEFLDKIPHDLKGSINND